MGYLYGTLYLVALLAWLDALDEMKEFITNFEKEFQKTLDQNKRSMIYYKSRR
ncbi:hypothetical protein EDO6_03040 [Paenibacillus xylanexedens]|nr:hypothetical protein EDO6_03040 [Paenibacillus xylanexedens]